MIKIVLVLTAIFFSLHATTTKYEVIEKMIKAYGGEKNLQKAYSYEEIWHIQRQTDGQKGIDNRKVVLPYFLKTELIYPEHTEVRVLIQDYGTKKYSGQISQAQGPMLDAMKLQRMRLFNPLTLKAKIDNITFKDTSKQYILSLKESGVVSNYFISKHSLYVEKVIGQLKMGSMDMEFLTIYQDYKKVYGVLWHHKEIKYAGATNTAIMTLKDIKFVKPPKL